MRPLRLTALLVLVLAVTAGCTRVHVWFLASDAYEGRDDGSAGAQKARDYLVGYLRPHAEALDGTTDPAAYLDPITGGANVVARIPGTDLAEEVVLVGAHYDHLSTCDVIGDDSVCNGATDNAAGVAIALEIARALAEAPRPPRRSVVLALWDREEDGLVGSRQFVADHPTLVDDVVAYVNYDIQGANLLPSLRSVTLAVGAETGGATLVGAVDAAGAAGRPLELTRLSAVFGQGRSDHRSFLDAGVPTVFFTDATGPCHHTTGDGYDVLDGDKLDEQHDIGLDLVRHLADAADAPTFVPGTPLATFEDATTMLDLVERGRADIDRFTPSRQDRLREVEAELAGVVAGGPDAFDAGDVFTTLSGAAAMVDVLATGECDGFLD